MRLYFKRLSQVQVAAFVKGQSKGRLYRENVCAITFKCTRGNEFTANLFPAAGVDHHLPELPIELAVVYDQDKQRDIAKEVLHRVEEQSNPNCRIFVTCGDCFGFSYFKHFSRLLKEQANEKKLQIGGCIFLGPCPTPMSNFAFSSWPFISNWVTRPLWGNPNPFLLNYYLILERKNSTPGQIRHKFNVMKKSVRENFHKYGAEEWSGNYLLKHEQEQWPLLFFSFNDFRLPNPKFVDKIVQFKRQQDPFRLVRHECYHQMNRKALIKDFIEFIEDCIDDQSGKKSKRKVSLLFDQKKRRR